MECPQEGRPWQRSGLSQGAYCREYGFPEFPELLAGATEQNFQQGFDIRHHHRPCPLPASVQQHGKERPQSLLKRFM